MPQRSLALAGDALPRRLRARAAPLPLRAGHAEGRLGALRARSRGSAPDARARRDRPRRRQRGRGAARDDAAWPSGGCPSGRSCSPASSRSPTRRARRRASTPPGRTRTGPTAPTGRRERERIVERMEAQVERFAPGFRDLILARHVLAPADLAGAQPQPRARRRGRGLLHARPGRLPPGAEPHPVPHAGARALSRQRGGLPRRRGPRRAGRRGGADGARRGRARAAPCRSSKPDGPAPL